VRRAAATRAAAVVGTAADALPNRGKFDILEQKIRRSEEILFRKENF
jgi:hypothetical protein